MRTYKKRTDRALSYLSEILPEKPKHLMILGSGLSNTFDKFLDEKLEIPYEDIPDFPQVTVQGHTGSLLFGKVKGIAVLLMKGRFHYYEGYDMDDVVFPIRVLSQMGIKSLYLTNAAGGLGEGLEPGDLMLIRDHIGFFAPSPLRGPNFDELGPRFPDQSQVYETDRLSATAKKLGIKLKEGVYCFTQGPMYETPAEIQVVKFMGGHAVGMSTVPEAITASHVGMRVRAISVISNFAAGILSQALSHEEVMTNSEKASKNLALLLAESLD